MFFRRGEAKSFSISDRLQKRNFLRMASFGFLIVGLLCFGYFAYGKYFKKTQAANGWNADHTIYTYSSAGAYDLAADEMNDAENPVSIVITGSGTVVTIYGQHTFKNVTITNNGVLTHAALVPDTDFYTAQNPVVGHVTNELTDSGKLKKVDLIITSTLSINTGGKIDVTGKGYPGGCYNITKGVTPDQRNVPNYVYGICDYNQDGTGDSTDRIGYGPGGGQNTSSSTSSSVGTSAGYGGDGGTRDISSAPARGIHYGTEDILDLVHGSGGAATFGRDKVPTTGAGGVYVNFVLDYYNCGTSTGSTCLNMFTRQKAAGAGGGIISILCQNANIANNGYLIANGEDAVISDGYSSKISGAGSGGSIVLKYNTGTLVLPSADIVDEYPGDNTCIASQVGATTYYANLLMWPKSGSIKFYGNEGFLNPGGSRIYDYQSGANIRANGGAMKKSNLCLPGGGGGRIAVGSVNTKVAILKTLTKISEAGGETFAISSPYNLVKGDVVTVKLHITNVTSTQPTMVTDEIYKDIAGTTFSLLGAPNCGGVTSNKCSITNSGGVITWNFIAPNNDPVDLTYQLTVQ